MSSIFSGQARMPRGERKSVLVCYHARCSDGFGAAWAAWKALGETAEYQPCSYDDKELPDVAGRDVYVLDFSFPPAAMEMLQASAASITLLDHHASAKKQFGAFRPACNCRIHFDLSQSGAALAWRHFHPAEPMPYLIRAVQSRDLWQWNVPGDRAFLAMLDIQPASFEAWDAVNRLRTDELEAFIDKGQSVVDAFASYCPGVADAARPVTLGDQHGLMVNAPALFTNDVGNLLAQQCGTFALVWHDKGDSIKCGLRSVPQFDCLPLASAFGGGGHPNAAAFHLPYARMGELLARNLQP